MDVRVLGKVTSQTPPSYSLTYPFSREGMTPECTLGVGTSGLPEDLAPCQAPGLSTWLPLSSSLRLVWDSGAPTCSCPGKVEFLSQFHAVSCRALRFL